MDQYLYSSTTTTTNNVHSFTVSFPPMEAEGAYFSAESGGGSSSFPLSSFQEEIDSPPSEPFSIVVTPDHPASHHHGTSTSQAAVTTTAIPPPSSLDSAMILSQEASHLLQTNLLEDALEAYQKAADCYLQQQPKATTSTPTTTPASPSPLSIVAAVNAAGCFRNMGAVSRLLHNYGDAVTQLQCAEELYTDCRNQLWPIGANSNHHRTPAAAAAVATTVTANRQEEEEEVESRSRSSSDHDDEEDEDDLEQLCLDLMVLETMQSRAVFHFQHQNDTEAAIECHEACVVRLLEQRRESKSQSNNLQSKRVEGVLFTPLTLEKHTDLLIVSLENLGGMYRTLHKNTREISSSSSSCGDFDDGDDSKKANLNGKTVVDADDNKERDLRTFQAGIAALQERHRHDTENKKLKLALTKILRHLSEIYVDRGCTDLAVDALHSAMDVELSDATAEPSQSALAAMDKMGLANEQRRDYEKALACYEKALLARSRYWGDNHIDVAKSLINVARILELQGNSEGSLDLYRAAHAIYAQQITSHDFLPEDEDDAAALLQLIPNLLEQERYAEARTFLTKALAIADDEERGHRNNNNFSTIDKSRIYFDLGQAYVGLKDYVSATICLVEAAKEEGQVQEDQVMALLQRVEQLQRESHHHHHHHSLGGAASRSFDRTLSTGPSFAEHHHLVMIHDGLSKSSSRDRRRRQRQPQDLFVSTSTPLSEEMAADSENVLQEKEDNVSLTEFKTKQKEHYNHPSSGSTLPTQHSETDFHAFRGGGSPFLNSSSPEGRFSPRSDEFSSILPSSDEGVGPLPRNEEVLSSPPSSLIGPYALEEDGHDNDDDFEHPEPSLLSSDQSNRRNGARNRGLGRRASPRKGQRDDNRSVGSRKKKFGEKLRLRGRQGFQSLPEIDDVVVDGPSSPQAAAPKVLASVAIDGEHSHSTDEDSLLNDAPVDEIYVKRDGDDVSEITLRFEDPNSSRESNQDWWWGVTAEGFGRWFPAAYVSQAVQAADAFLSAKAIHSQSKATKHQAESALEMMSEDESLLEGGSNDPQDFLSNVGITSTKTAPQLPTIPTSSQPGANPARMPHYTSLFSSSGPHHFTGGKDVKLEIAACRESLQKQQNELGKDHATVATSLFTLAVLYSRDKEVASSLEYAAEALRIQRSNGNFVDASRSLHFLADLYLHQKQYKQAMLHYSKALTLETSHFGYNSDETARTLNCIGTVKSLQNDFREAMESHEEALRILKECHGEDLKHPLVTETLCQIGSVYYRERNSHTKATASPDGYTTFIEGGMLEVIGRAHEERGSYKMAIAFFEEKLRFLESKDRSRENLEDAASTLNGLGMLSSRAGLMVEAIDFYEKALSIQLQLGCDEVHLATARVLTGAVQFQLGNWRKALKLLQDAVLCLREELGERHETVAATHYQIGIVQGALCEYDLAMDSLNEALEIQHELLGDDHPATLRTRREIGNLYGIYKAELPTAFEHFNFVLKHQKQLHGERHPNIAETLHSIGCAHVKNGDYAEALRVLEECYYMRVEFLGWDHPLQATTLHVIARIHMKRGRLKKAVHICDVVLGIRREALTDRHIDVARALTTKGSCLVAQGETDKGMECLSEALSLAKESVGNNHPTVADIYSELGALHLRKCQFEEARNAIQRALDIYCYSNLDDDYDGIVDAKEKLERVRRDELLCV